MPLPSPTGTSIARAWTVADSADLYRIDGWSNGYFGINSRGHFTVRPWQREGREGDLLELVELLRDRGYSAPLLLRFSDVLDHRLEEIAAAFRRAITDHGYEGEYRAVYPIKVNQQRQVVEEVWSFGRHLSFGLEVGSKPELIAALALTSGDIERPLICNGFKDDEYLETVVLAAKLGRPIIPVIESLVELRLLIKQIARHGVRPTIGIRLELATPGGGRWGGPAGARSKFGLTVPEILEAMDLLRDRRLLDRLALLHGHMGSQIHDIKTIKDGLDELTRVYTELVGLGAGLEYLDIGGGLGIDYEGSQSRSEASMNYTLDEYAGDIVYRVANICDQAGVAHPTIITECGRAMVAYHSVLVFNVLGVNQGVSQPATPADVDRQVSQDDPQPLLDLAEAHRMATNGKSLTEAYHDAEHALDELLHLFSLGHLGLDQRAAGERLYWATIEAVRQALDEHEQTPEELSHLESDLRSIYFCNFSLFQSLPDSWALGQLFPVVPIHRLDERPCHRAVLTDITCDADGTIDLFPGHHGTKNSLELHELRDGEEYYLAVCLVGAYQETLGDLHNLFGDTHAVHARVDPDGRWSIDGIVEGDSVLEVLSYVQFDPADLVESIRQDCERAVRTGRLTVEESRAFVAFYRTALDGYTYLEPEGADG